MATPPDKSLPRHGGDLAFATKVHGEPTDGWLDLSTGINPDPYPAPTLPPEALTRLPDREALHGLLAAARVAYRVPAKMDIVAVPGTEIAIRLLPFIAPSGKVAIVWPTYGSHVDAWRGRETVVVSSVSDIPSDAAVAVVVNPNNPDGKTTQPEFLSRRVGTFPFLIVDEAFADVAPDISIIPLMANQNILVLRSLGKFYGLAGVRLGFVVAAPIVAARLERLLGDWPVSGPALTIGAAALSDDAWRATARARLRETMSALRALLTRHNLAIVGGTDLFVLVATPEAHALYRALLERGILTRAFADQPHWLRFGLPTANGMTRLATALSAPR